MTQRAIAYDPNATLGGYFILHNGLQSLLAAGSLETHDDSHHASYGLDATQRGTTGWWYASVPASAPDGAYCFEFRRYAVAETMSDTDDVTGVGVAYRYGSDELLVDAAENAAAILDDTGTSGVVVGAGSKTGYSLAAAGLDAIPTTAPSGTASTFREMIVATWRWFYKKTEKNTTAGTITTYADDNSTALTTQTYTETSTAQTKNSAS